MPISEYMKQLREAVGTRLLLMPSVAAVIHDDLGRVLTLRTTEGHWSLPAGAIDPGETPRQAVIRETLEECGLEVQPVALLDVLGGAAFRHTYRNGDEVEPVMCVFLCEVVGGQLHCDGVETTEAHWLPPAECASRLPIPVPPTLFTAAKSQSER